MTIIFNNNNYKYEIEAVVKLFIPATKFNFLYEERNADDDIIMTQVKVCKTYTYLFSYVRIENVYVRKSKRINNNDDSVSIEFELCTLIFHCLNKIIGVKPKWGLLTGIRPVKKVNDLINLGKSKEDVFTFFKEKYLVDDDKIKLSYKTSCVQLPLINSLKPQTVSIYISIPFCPTRCTYCSFVSHSMKSAKKLIPEYIVKLCEEMKIVGQMVRDLNFKVDTVYFGGGTPTSLTAEQLQIIMYNLQNNFDLSEIREYCVEAGRADTINRGKLQVIKDMGATRISINPQTFNDEVLHAIGRNHTSKETLEAFYLSREIGFDNINMDVIAGLPTESIESFKNTIDKTISLNPDGITVHTLTIKRSANLYTSAKEYIENPANEMVDYSFKRLIENYYNPYYLYRQKNTLNNLENTGYSKAGKESLYNIYIMDESQAIFALGGAASTKLISKSGRIERVHNHKFPYEYINRFDELMEKKKFIYDFYNDEEKNYAKK